MEQTRIQRPTRATGQDARTVDVLVCGGGISGLSLAAWLTRAGIDAVVLDKNERPGGVIGTVREGGFLFERGPNTILDKYPSMTELLEFARIEDEALRTPMRGLERWVWLKGRLHRAPEGPLSFAASGLLPIAGKLALLREPLIRANPDDETIADFIRRRFNEDWLHNLVTPMISGIWAGDPEHMSIEHSFPVMKRMERLGGSLLVGAVRHLRQKAHAARLESERTGRPRHKKTLLSFRSGLDALPTALAARLGERYFAATRIERLRREDGGYVIEARHRDEPRRWRARRLVVAAEAHPAAEWIEDLDSEVAAVLRSFHYNRLIAVGVGIDRAEAQLPPGFGFLVPRGEGARSLGVMINSNFLPGRAPEGKAALSIFIGGDLDNAAFELNDEEIVGTVRRDLRAALGWEGRLRALHIERWPKAIPQYDMRHAARLRQIEAAEARWPGLRLIGNWRGGVSITDRVEYTRSLAGRMIQENVQIQGRA